MQRYAIFLVTAGLLITPNPLTAAPISLRPVRPTFTPGVPLIVQVELPPISNLASYNVDLLLESNVGVAGNDFFFDVDGTEPVTSHYVFPTTDNYFDAANIDSSSTHRLTLSDFNLSGVNVVEGINNSIAKVVINTTPDFLGELRLSVDVSGLILDTPDVMATPVPGFDDIKASTEAAGAISISQIPEPSTRFTACFICGFALLTCLLRKPAKRARSAGTVS